MIKGLGGTAITDVQQPGNPVLHLSFGDQMTDAGLADLKQLKHLLSLSFVGSKVHGHRPGKS